MKALTLFTMLFFSLSVFAQEKDVTGWQTAKKIEKQLYNLDEVAYSLEEFRVSQQRSTLLQIVGLGIVSGAALLSGDGDNAGATVFLGTTGGILLIVSWIVERASYRKLKKAEEHLRKASGNDLIELPEL